MKKEVRDIIKKLLAGKQHVKISDVQILMKCLLGNTGQYGIAASDIIERAFNDGIITEDDVITLIEEMIDDNNNDRITFPTIPVDPIQTPVNPWRDNITVMYGVSIEPYTYDNNSVTGVLNSEDSSAITEAYNQADVQTAQSLSGALDDEARRKVKYGIPNFNKQDKEYTPYTPFYGEKPKKNKVKKPKLGKGDV